MRSHRLWRALSERRGEGYVDVIVLVLCAVMVLALAMRVLPVFIQKQQLDTFATELVREAEVSGRVGAETSRPFFCNQKIASTIYYNVTLERRKQRYVQ